MRQLDQDFARTLAKTIRPATAVSKATSPIGSQFFADDPVGVTHLSTDELAGSLAGADFNAHVDWVAALAAQGYSGIALNRPKIAGDVSEIGLGVGSGWTGPKPPVASGAKALLLNRLAKAANPDSAVLVETIKSIVTQLLGVSVENVDPVALKAKLGKTIASRPDLGLRLAKALGTVPDVNLSLDDLVRMGAQITKTGDTLHISV
jgi:hypothetical protein